MGRWPQIMVTTDGNGNVAFPKIKVKRFRSFRGLIVVCVGAYTD